MYRELDAVANGVLVVAAVGNNKYAPVKPWKYASYPAALPHVLGVGSYGKDGDVSTFSNQDPVFVERLTRLIPMGRMARVDEYCAAVQFLCSDASSYMTGQNIVMDGGRSVW